jgi:hypothetical protein
MSGGLMAVSANRNREFEALPKTHKNNNEAVTTTYLLKIRNIILFVYYYISFAV